MSNQPELKLMQLCFKWFHNNHPKLRGILWRVENERKRNKYEQMIAKSTGLVSGVADFCMLYDGAFHAIELKAGSGRQSGTQKKWQRLIESQGGQYHIVRSLDEFQELIQEVL